MFPATDRWERVEADGRWAGGGRDEWRRMAGRVVVSSNGEQ